MILRHTRLRIDPWTGGAAESLLFTEDALYGGRIRVVVTLRDAAGAPLEQSAAERALLLLAVRDLAAGDVPIGAEGGVGRGGLGPAGGAGEFATLVENDVPRAMVRLDEATATATVEPIPLPELAAIDDRRADYARALASDFEALGRFFSERP